MPVIEFTRAVGTRFKPGTVANLPLTTLKGLALEAGVKDWTKLGTVRAQGAACHMFMADLKKQDAIGAAKAASPGEKGVPAGLNDGDEKPI